MSSLTNRALLQTVAHIKTFIRNYNIPRRAFMYIPGDDKRKLDKTLTLDVDCVVMDCEDGVALNKKDVARQTLREILDRGKPQKSRNYDWGVRINSVDSGLCLDDLNALLTAKNLPDTISLPKVETPSQLHWLANETSKLIPSDKTVNLVVFIESAIAVINLVDICKTSRELSNKGKFIPVALVCGSDDLCASIGATRTEESTEILYARQKVVLVAKAFGLQAIDMGYIQYKDLEGLRKQSEQGARMGYTGKQVIHPLQVPVVQEAFLPNKQQVEWAKGLLEAFESHQKSGKGAFSYKGSMIDMPTMKQAQNIIDLMNSVNK